MAAQTQTRRILIKVDTGDSKALNDIASRMGYLNKNTKSLASNMGFLTNAFRGWLGFLGVRELVRMSDQMQNLFNRLKLVTGSTEAAENALSGLESMANRTNQSISGVAEVYNRVAVSLGKFGRNTEQVQALTETLINTFRLSGATTAETTNTIIQLSQAFSSGELRGQELRSVMEQNATLALLLRERFGDDIYKKATEGSIRLKDVLDILAENQERINTQAKELTPTIEQSLTKAFNKLTLAVDEANRKFGISSGFAKSLEFVVDNLAAVSFAVGILAASAIPNLTLSVGSLGKALLALNLNPLILAVGAIVGGTYYLIQRFEWAEKVALRFAGVVNILGSRLLLLAKAGATAVEVLSNGAISMESYKTIIQGMSDEMEANGRAAIQLAESTELFRQVTVNTEQPLEDYTKLINDLSKNFDKLKDGKVKTIREELGLLNTALLNGIITLEQYNKMFIQFEIDKLTRQFKEGRLDVFAYSQQLRDLRIADLNRQLREGAINLAEFNNLVSLNKLGVLDLQFRNGKISLQEYNTELIKLEDKVRVGSAFQAGVGSYIESVGTLSENIARGIEQTFGHLEDNLLEFMKTGKFNFKNFTQSILDDLTKIIVRASIVRPLAQGILGFAGIGAGQGVDSALNATMAANPGVFAKGGAFDRGNVIPFAKGGLVDSPTAFTFGGGRSGVMGEAGTEAILPLARGKNGNLGVQAATSPVQINIINSAGADVSTQESTGPGGERRIDVFIESKVKEGLAKGTYDKVLKSNYNLSRKGS